MKLDMMIYNNLNDKSLCVKKRKIKNFAKMYCLRFLFYSRKDKNNEKK